MFWHISFEHIYVTSAIRLGLIYVYDLSFFIPLIKL